MSRARQPQPSRLLVALLAAATFTLSLPMSAAIVTAIVNWPSPVGDLVQALRPGWGFAPVVVQGVLVGALTFLFFRPRGHRRPRLLRVAIGVALASACMQGLGLMVELALFATGTMASASAPGEVSVLVLDMWQAAFCVALTVVLTTAVSAAASIGRSDAGDRP